MTGIFLISGFLVIAVWGTLLGRRQRLGEYTSNRNRGSAWEVYCTTLSSLVGGWMFFGLNAVGYEAGLVGVAIGVGYAIGLGLLLALAPRIKAVMTEYGYGVGAFAGIVLSNTPQAAWQQLPAKHWGLTGYGPVFLVGAVLFFPATILVRSDLWQRVIHADSPSTARRALAWTIPCLLASMLPLYVFAGSKTRKEFLQLGPIDFWSRITHIVEMQHPLELGEAGERFRTAEDYLRLFWFKQVESYFKCERLVEPPDYTPQRNLFEPLRAKFTDWWKFFCSEAVGEFVAWEIAGALCAPGQAVPSIRTLRGTVARCFNSLFHALLYHKRASAPLEKWAEIHRKEMKNLKAAGKSAKEPIERLKELMGMLHGDCESGSPLTVEEEAAIAEIRALIRASASIQV